MCHAFLATLHLAVVEMRAHELEYIFGPALSLDVLLLGVQGTATCRRILDTLHEHIHNRAVAHEVWVTFLLVAVFLLCW
jgi:hypothetical protein